MRVVIATTDGIRVHIGHFGDAKFYFIYEVRKDPRFPKLEVVENPCRDEEEEHGHGNRAKREGLLRLFNNPDAIVATFFGPGGEEFFRSHGVLPVKVRPWATVEEGLKQAIDALRSEGSGQD